MGGPRSLFSGRLRRRPDGDVDRQEHTPALGPVLDAELVVAAQVGEDRHAVYREVVSDLGTDSEGAPLEVAKHSGLSFIGRQLHIAKADGADEQLLVQKARYGDVQMRIDAVPVVGIGVFEVVGQAGGRGELPAGRGIEIAVGAAGVDRGVSDTQVGKPVGILGTHGYVARDVGHPVVHALVPEELRRGIEIPEASEIVGSVRGQRPKPDVGGRLVPPGQERD